jgi:membrane associated rhomboid family serine protease
MTTINKKEIWRSVRFPAIFIVVIWLIELTAQSGSQRLVWLGIRPRTFEGLIGIFTSPFIHGDLDHILSNTLPIFLVGTGLIYFYKEIAWRVIGMIWMFTGIWVWLIARPESHIGASGLIYGFVFFLFFSGLLRKDTRLMAVSMLITFLYGSMVWGILPVNQLISWESHLSGSVAGIFAAFYFRGEGPQRPKAQWEIDEELEKNNPPVEEILDPTDESPATTQPPVNIQYHYAEKQKINNK